MTASETPDIILDDQTRGLLRVILNRPEKRNALTRSMLAQLLASFQSIRRREDLRAVIVCGAGEAFSAGSDIEEVHALDPKSALDRALLGQKVCEAIEECGVPVIAAVNGIAAGGGFELALACHIRIASTHARFSLPEAKLGVIPAYGGTQRLARATGSGRALELMLAAGSLDAADALRVGLVNRVVEPAQLLAEAESLVSEISKLAPLAIRSCLEAVMRGASLKLDEGLALEAELFSRLFDSEDMREGTSAFLEKRPPVFKGK